MVCLFKPEADLLEFRGGMADKRKHLCPKAQFDSSYSARKFMAKQLTDFHIYHLTIFWPNTKSTPDLGPQYSF